MYSSQDFSKKLHMWFGCKHFEEKVQIEVFIFVY